MRQLPTQKAFSLIEMMTAIVILMMILGIIFGITLQISNAWKTSSAKTGSLQSARMAFEMMTRRISQATLNSYWGYDNVTNPTKYLRRSELHFVIGKDLLNKSPRQVSHAIFFQAPLGYADAEGSTYKGLDNLMNACGYYVEYNEDSSRPQFIESLTPPLAKKYRYRLMQWVQPSEKFNVYQTLEKQWFNESLSLSTASTQVMAENIVALILLPKKRGSQGKKLIDAGSNYEYDSRNPAKSETFNRLPSLVEVVMVAVEENSFALLGNTPSEPELGIGNLFKQSDQLDSDLEKLQETLDSKLKSDAQKRIPLKHRVFRTDVPIWSSE